MSPPLQTRLLRVLAEGEFYRVGGQLPVKVDVRVIAATHQDLEARVQEGLFREDLLHRLNVIRIEVPPLRQRREDIPELLQHYLDVAAIELGVAPKVLTDEAARGARGVRLAGQRAPTRQCVPAPDGAGRRARDHARATFRRISAAAATGRRTARAGRTRLRAGRRRGLLSGGAPLLDDAMPEFERTLIRGR